MILPRWLERALLRELPNPGFPLTCDQARADLAAMARRPVALQRPLVCLAGWRALLLLPKNLIANLGPMLASPGSHPPLPALPIAFPLVDHIPAAAQRVVDAVEACWPNPSGTHTVEVDVIGVSMGGLVARTAAAGLAGSHRKRLRIARLFTLGTPHRGARLAEDYPVDRAARDMLPGSTFLQDLDAALDDHAFELVCYARLHDEFVGATRCAPPGSHPHWVSGFIALSHLTIGQDPRILADIARRLRGEPSYTRFASMPPCD